MGLSQQLDSRRNLSRIILYVSGGWLSCLFLDITPTQLYSEAYITEQEIRVCPAALLERTRRESLHHNILLKRSHSRLLPILFDIAGYSDSFMGGWLGHFSDRQCTLRVLVPFHGTQSLTPCGINSSILWHKTGSRPAFIVGSTHFKPLCSRSITLGDLEYRCRPTRRM